jgi:hypothetical protein
MRPSKTRRVPASALRGALGEALVATGIGIGVAVPAVLARCDGLLSQKDGDDVLGESTV